MRIRKIIRRFAFTLLFLKCICCVPEEMGLNGDGTRFVPPTTGGVNRADYIEIAENVCITESVIIWYMIGVIYSDGKL